MALLHVHHYSETLKMNMDMSVILPEKPKWKKPGGAKVLYLLHGLGDDNTAWETQTSIVRYAAQYHLAIVMPNAHTGFYADMDRGLPYFTYIAQELPTLCPRLFPQMSARREDTFAAGLSMGGYGALKCALRAPETFSQAASLSGAVDVVQRTQETRSHRKRMYRDIFGPKEQAAGSFNDLYAAAREVPKCLRPRLYMWCGTEDFLWHENVKMRDHLYKENFDLTWSESPGGHTWDRWDEQIRAVLRWLPLERGQ